MSRISFGITALLIAGTIPVTAQQPDGTGPRGATSRAVLTRATPARVDGPRLLPGTRPDVFSVIQGNALTSSDGALANASVRLRDARFGQIVGTQVTDQAGLFAFRGIDPGSYIVEIVDANRASVLAASQVLNAGPGQAILAVVKLPFRTSPFAGVLHTSSRASPL